MGKMIPVEMLEKIQEYKISGRSCIDLENMYNKEKMRSRIAANRASNVGKQIYEMMCNDEYSEVMNAVNYYPRINTREKLRDNFSKMMFFFEKINPEWAEKYNELEEGKTRNMSVEIDPTEYSMQTLVEDALALPNELYGNTPPEKLRDIKISALAMFYANKIAHQSRYLRERYMAHYLNYSAKDNENFNTALKQDKFKEISDRLKSYYMFALEYAEAKKDGKSEDVLKRIREKAKLCKGVLKGYGFDDESLLLKNSVIKSFVQLERDAFAIKDVAMSDLVFQLEAQKDISYGKKLDSAGKEVLVVDLPNYGQFSVHTKGEECIVKAHVPRYPYPVYSVGLGSALLMMSNSSATEYVKKKCGDKANIMKALREDFDSKEEAHQIAVKLGYNKNALKKIYDAPNHNQSI